MRWPPLLMVAACLAACAPRRYDSVEEALAHGATIKRSGFEDLENNGWNGQGDGRAAGGQVIERGGPSALSPFGYALSLAQFDGPDRLSKAQALMTRHKLWGSATLAEREGMLEITTGHWERTDDQAMLKAMNTWQRREVDGERPFRFARICSRATDKAPGTDPRDAASYTGFQSLLVGFYTEKGYGEGRHREVERIVRVLAESGPSDRRGAVTALFRHGDGESAILVGLFTRKDHWVEAQQTGSQFTTEIPGPFIQAMQQRFPAMVKDGKKLPAGGAENGPPWEPAQLSELR